MIDMEEDIFKRAFVHWKIKRGILVERDQVIKEFWTDYFSGNPIYISEVRFCNMET